jgi:hypothetical protein
MTLKDAHTSGKVSFYRSSVSAAALEETVLQTIVVDCVDINKEVAAKRLQGESGRKD